MLRFSKDQLMTTTTALLIASGCAPREAKVISNILIWCDQIGRHNQGIWRLPLLTKRFSQGLIKSPCEAKYSQLKPAVMLMDAQQGSGHYIAQQAMDKAIALAKHNGVGVIGVHNSNFFGAGAYYINQACQSGMIGIGLSNSFPKVAAYGGVKPVLGTNPFAFAAPRRNGQHLLLDMATSASAGSSITKSKEQGKTLDQDIAIDMEGNAITDPALVSQGALLPFGGAKGFGLSLFVEILSGVLTGAGFSHGVNSMINDYENGGKNGHFFIALDISSFIDSDYYYQRIEELLALVKLSHDSKKILYPGEIRWDHYQQSLIKGIPIDSDTIQTLTVLCEQYQVQQPMVPSL